MPLALSVTRDDLLALGPRSEAMNCAFMDADWVLSIVLLPPPMGMLALRLPDCDFMVVSQGRVVEPFSRMRFRYESARSTLIEPEEVERRRMAGLSPGWGSIVIRISPDTVERSRRS